MVRASRKRVEELRLVYASAISRPLGPGDLDAIKRSSARNNAALGVSGLLLLRGSGFHAVLEGPARDVLHLMETIITDNRHCDIRILKEEIIARRRFANWSFAALSLVAPCVPSPYPLEEFSEAFSNRLRQ